MLNILTVATKPQPLADTFDIAGTMEFAPLYQVYAMQNLPITVKIGKFNRLVTANWGIYHTEGANSEILMSYPLEKALKSKNHGMNLRSKRCIIPANLFFGSKNRVPYGIRLLKHRLFGLGGFYQFDQKLEKYSVAIYLTESPDILRPFLGPSMPLILEPPDAIKWIQEQDLRDLFSLADKSRAYYYDLFEVDKKVLHAKYNRRELIKPLGPSLREQMDQKVKFYGALDQPRTYRGK